MILFPAIDLKDGNCVRLLRGAMEAATVFSDSPAAQAKKFEDAGAEWLHVVDLNGAFAGRPVNEAAVRAILGALKIPVQLGGGIRTMLQVEAWLAAGISRVILGTVALKDPEMVKQACQRFPGKIAVGIDAREGMVAVEGWAEKSDMKVLTLARKFEDAGVACLIYTDVGRDGAMEGPDVAGTKVLAAAVSIPVIASGGVSSLADLKVLKREIPKLYGIISGRAIYEGAIDVKEGLKVMGE